MLTRNRPANIFLIASHGFTHVTTRWQRPQGTSTFDDYLHIPSSNTLPPGSTDRFNRQRFRARTTGQKAPRQHDATPPPPVSKAVTSPPSSASTTSGRQQGHCWHACTHGPTILGYYGSAASAKKSVSQRAQRTNTTGLTSRRRPQHWQPVR
jgi:hypothetical protein